MHRHLVNAGQRLWHAYGTVVNLVLLCRGNQARIVLLLLFTKFRRVGGGGGRGASRRRIVLGASQMSGTP
jgi:hypothetical protein